MLTLHQTLPPDQADTAVLFQTVAEAVQRVVQERSAPLDLIFELSLSGPRTKTTPPPVIASAALAQSAHPPLAACAEQLESALTLLHGRSGIFVVRTCGAITGAFLEMALMADHHVMHTGAVMTPAGLFDSYVPLVSGWSRLIERVGAGRASSLLLTRASVSASEALAVGLCEAVEDTPVGTSAVTGVASPAEPDNAPMSLIALRLAHEISERTTRTGGLTPRQTRMMERAAFALAFSSDDPRQGIASFFAGRPARFASDHTGHPVSERDPVTE